MGNTKQLSSKAKQSLERLARHPETGKHTFLAEIFSKKLWVLEQIAFFDY